MFSFGRSSDRSEVGHLSIQNPLSLDLSQKVVDCDLAVVSKEYVRVENLHGVTLKFLSYLAVRTVFETLLSSYIDE